MKLYCPITIDLYKVYPLQVMEAQQGNVGRGAIVTLTAGSAVIDPTDETVEVYAKKPDGTVSWLECSVEDGKIKIDFTNQMLMSPGILQVELRMKDDEDDITTPIFKVKVNKSNVQSAGRSENELPLLDQIKKNAEDAKAAAEAAEKAVGDKITNPSIGAVGQILEVESVDEKGKPLTYKAVDKPEGGVDKELSQIIHSSKYGIVSDGFSDTVIVIGKDAAAGDVIKYVIEENSGDITVIYDNNDTGEFNITTIDHAGEAAGEKTLTAEKYCTYTFPSEMDVYLPFNIPAKTSQLTDDVGFAKQEEVGKLSEDIATKASAIKEKASGEVIVVTDSDEQKPLGLAIDGKSEQNQYSGKNRLPNKGKTQTIEGVKFIVNDDGSVTADGKSTALTMFYIISKASMGGMFIENGSYFLSGCPSGGSDKTYRMQMWGITPSGGTAYDFGNGTTFEYTNENSDYNVVIYINEGVTVSNLTFKPMISVDGGEYEPYVGGKPSPSTEYQQEIANTGKYDEASGKYAVEVKCNNGNLLPYPYLETTKEMAGVTYTDNGDGGISFSGTTTGFTTFTFYNGVNVFRGKTLFALLGTYTNMTLLITLYDSNNAILYDKQTSKEQVIDFNDYPTCTKVYMYMKRLENNVATNGAVYPVVVSGDIVPTKYEQFKKPTTAEILLDEPLRGLPVSSDGNYTDNNGQQYVSDELNSVDKKRTSRINRLKLTPEQEWTYRLTTTYGNHNFQISKLPNNNYGSIYAPYVCAFKSTHFSFLNEQFDTPNLKEPKAYVYDKELTVSFPPNSDMNTLAKWKEFLANNDVYAEYILEEPITEEIDIDLGSLSMFYPTTIISNDCNANMEVTYIADTKAYIDKKFAELATAMV